MFRRHSDDLMEERDASGGGERPPPPLAWEKLPVNFRLHGFMLTAVVGFSVYCGKADPARAALWYAAGFGGVVFVTVLGHLVARQTITNSYRQSVATVQAQIIDLSATRRELTAIASRHIDACLDLALRGEGQYLEDLVRLAESEDRAISQKALAALSRAART